MMNLSNIMTRKNPLKTAACSALLAATLALPAGTATSGPLAEKAGQILFKSVISFVLGTTFDSIFGGDALTPQKVADAVEKGRIDLETDMANESYSELISAMRDYHADDVLDTRKRRLDTVLDHANKVKAQMEGIMSKRFWQVMKSYTEVRSYQFAFLAESASINHSNDTLIQLGDEAAEAMQYVYHAFNHFYGDSTQRNCIKKKSDQVFYNMQGEALSPTMKVFKDGPTYDFSTYLCRDKVSQMLNTGMTFMPFKLMPHKDILASHGVFQRPGHNEFYFTIPYFKNHHRNPYHYHGPYDSREAAEARRIQLAGKEYPTDLGRVRKLMATWYQIAMAHASSDKKTLANEYKEKWDVKL